jgi:hypothetical protein
LELECDILVFQPLELECDVLVFQPLDLECDVLVFQPLDLECDILVLQAFASWFQSLLSNGSTCTAYGWGAVDPRVHTTYNARTFLQPQLNKVGYRLWAVQL